jgi:hypothetical protein
LLPKQTAGSPWLGYIPWDVQFYTLFYLHSSRVQRCMNLGIVLLRTWRYMCQGTAVRDKRILERSKMVTEDLNFPGIDTLLSGLTAPLYQSHGTSTVYWMHWIPHEISATKSRVNSVLLFHVRGQEEEETACILLVFMWLCGVGSTKESILLLLLLSQIFLEPIPSFQDKGGICRACMSMPSFFPRLGLGCSCSYCPLYVVHAFVALHSYEIQPPNPWFPLIFVFVFATLCRKQEHILCCFYFLEVLFC